MAATASDMPAEHDGLPALSLVVPAFNEAENLKGLVEEIADAMENEPAFELVYVDDGSTDGTRALLSELRRTFPWLNPVAHAARHGQSAAIATGVKAARGATIVTLDGDGQNDPADIPKLLAAYRDGASDLLMVCGQRAKRRDTAIKRASSRIANGVRGGLLGDGTPDTGCGLKVFSRQTFLELPHFDHMHRFLPALIIRAGGRAVSVPVGHRPRQAGQSKYGLWNRLWVGIVDLFGVYWLTRRALAPQTRPQTRSSNDTEARG